MHIASPCHENWNTMTPRDAGRHCLACDQVVVDLTGLKTAERRDRMSQISSAITSGKRVCVRGRLDRDGMLAGSRRVLTGGMAMILAMTIAGCQGDGPDVQRKNQPDPDTQQTMGLVPAPQPVVKPDVAQGFPSRVMQGEVAVPPTRAETCDPIIMGHMMPQPNTVAAPKPEKQQ